MKICLCYRYDAMPIVTVTYDEVREDIQMEVDSIDEFFDWMRERFIAPVPGFKIVEKEKKNDNFDD
jgi:hypothetical protein